VTNEDQNVIINPVSSVSDVACVSKHNRQVAYVAHNENLAVACHQSEKLHEQVHCSQFPFSNMHCAADGITSPQYFFADVSTIKELESVLYM